jgi:hypothetical protein
MSVGLFMYQLGKDVPAATKNFLRRRFLCDKCRIKGR